mgnify:FL=1
MKNSKIVLFLAAFVVGITGCEVESEKHEHTFSKEWTSDAIAHWHAATCEHKTEISGIAAHTFGEWKVTKEASEKQGGEKKRICSVCNYVDIAKLEHVHTFGEWAVTKKATESEEGERQRTCSACKYIEKETIAKLEHVHIFGSLTVIKEATELEDGLGERTCSSCGYVEKVPICALNHTHKFATEWTSDGTNHWHVAVCGHAAEISDKEEHKWNEEIIKTATCTEDGEKKLVCAVCDRTKTEVIPPTGHSFSEEWTSNETKHWHVATCGDTEEISDESVHSFGDWRVIKIATENENGEREKTCSICKYVYKEVTSSILGTLVKVEGKVILGTETWMPESYRFYKNREKFTILDLYVSDHEVTRKEYKNVMGDDPSIGKAFDADGHELTGDDVLNNPVNYVTIFDALSYCNKLSKSEGLDPCYTLDDSDDPDKLKKLNDYDFKSSSYKKIYCDFTKNGYRLPTLDEWEYLARGGEDYKYSGNDTKDAVFAYSKEGTFTVKSKQMNGYKLYDMSGNVSEYCWGYNDPYHNDLDEYRTYPNSLLFGNYSLYSIPVLGAPYAKNDSNGSYSGGDIITSYGKRFGYSNYPPAKETGFRVVRTVTE